MSVVMCDIKLYRPSLTPTADDSVGGAVARAYWENTGDESPLMLYLVNATSIQWQPTPRPQLATPKA